MKKPRIFHALTFSLLLITWCCFYSSSVFASLITKPDGEVVNSLAPMLKKAMPAVVNIAAQGRPGAVDSSMLGPGENEPENVPRPGPGPQQRRPPETDRQLPGGMVESIGSGVIVDARKGYVLTNAHLLKDMQIITVTLTDGRHFPAKKIGEDVGSDIAVLQIPADNLTALPLGNSNDLNVGDAVVAIGNPFGLNRFGPTSTATAGIISALHRSGMEIESYENFIQTDASINPGNSGGALVNINGELIGINTAILAPGGGNVGIGFAIPVNMADSIMRQIIKYGSVRRGLMGIIVQSVTPELAAAMGVKTQGAIVAKVNSGSPAENAGVRTEDIVIKMNGQTIDNAAQVRNLIGLLRVGDQVSMDILRDGKKLTMSAKIIDPRQHEEALQSKNSFIFGVAMRDYAEQSPYHGAVKGVIVTGLLQESPAWRSGLRPGDVITTVDHQTISNVAQLETAVKQQRKDALVMRVLRGPGALYLVIK